MKSALRLADQADRVPDTYVSIIVRVKPMPIKPMPSSSVHARLGTYDHV